MKKYIVCSLLALALTLSNSLQAEPKPAAPADPPKTTEKTSDKSNRFSGTITAIDVNAATVTVKHSTREDSKAFKCPADCKFATLEKKKAVMADLKQGDKVLVLYTEDNGAAVAKKIGPTQSAKNQAKKAAE